MYPLSDEQEAIFSYFVKTLNSFTSRAKGMAELLKSMAELLCTQTNIKMVKKLPFLAYDPDDRAALSFVHAAFDISSDKQQKSEIAQLHLMLAINLLRKACEQHHLDFPNLKNMASELMLNTLQQFAQKQLKDFTLATKVREFAKELLMASTCLLRPELLDKQSSIAKPKLVLHTVLRAYFEKLNERDAKAGLSGTMQEYCAMILMDYHFTHAEYEHKLPNKPANSKQERLRQKCKDISNLCMGACARLLRDPADFELFKELIEAKKNIRKNIQEPLFLVDEPKIPKPKGGFNPAVSVIPDFTKEEISKLGFSTKQDFLVARYNSMHGNFLNPEYKTAENGYDAKKDEFTQLPPRIKLTRFKGTKTKTFFCDNLVSVDNHQSSLWTERVRRDWSVARWCEYLQKEKAACVSSNMAWITHREWIKNADGLEEPPEKMAGELNDVDLGYSKVCSLKWNGQNRQ